MKAYLVKLSLENSRPLIWRRVLMPADCTYKRLHDTIQNSFNFQSGYPADAYRLYEFDLKNENMLVTNNEQAYDEHQHFKKNPEIYAKQLETIEPQFREFEVNHQENLRIEVRKPTGIKIDDYLKKHKTIVYNYDFGDAWKITVTLEEIVEDYHFGFPMLIDGAETAPPEDVGGISGYNKFLRIYRDPKHRQHKEIKEWAISQSYEEYSSDLISSRLKSVVYKKNDWDSIYAMQREIYRKKYGDL